MDERLGGNKLYSKSRDISCDIQRFRKSRCLVDNFVKYSMATEATDGQHYAVQRTFDWHAG